MRPAKNPRAAAAAVSHSYPSAVLQSDAAAESHGDALAEAAATRRATRTADRVPAPTVAWPDRVTAWLTDGLLLALFMVSVGVFVPLIEAPGSWVREQVSSPVLRRAMVGVAMGLTAMALIYSPLGGISGAHMNPAVTLTFLRIGRIRRLDAAAYITAQVLGGVLGVGLIAALVGRPFTDRPIHYAQTLPGSLGWLAAGLTEGLMAFGMMSMVLVSTNLKATARFTGVFAGCLVALYITVAAPISGMSMNPARTFASAAHAGELRPFWLYVLGPCIGMLAAAELYHRIRRLPRPHCCKLNHDHHAVCIHCGCDGPIRFDAHRPETRP